MSKYAKATNVRRRDSDWKNQQRLRKENVFAEQRHIATQHRTTALEVKKTFHETFDGQKYKLADLPRFQAISLFMLISAISDAELFHFLCSFHFTALAREHST